MRRRIELFSAGLLVALVAVSCSDTRDGERTKTADDVATGNLEDSAEPLRLAVVTGGHAFDVPNFYKLLRRLPGVDAYPQHIEHFASSSEEIRDAYDVVLFYGMDQPTPKDEQKAVIERLVERGQGVVILHHALLAWKDWDLWHKLAGFDNRNFSWKDGLGLTIQVADDKHAITDGFSAFDIIDEGYILKGQHDGQGSILLTVDHENAMDEVAWSRQHEKCRVFCLSLGHDDKAWSNASFEDILRRGIVWTAGPQE